MHTPDNRSILSCFQGIHYVGGMAEGETRRVLVDQITEGQVTWVPMDREYDRVSL